MKKISLLLVLLGILWSCINAQNMIYYYYDGSGNQYKIENQTIEYIPKLPSESSSGIYDGGKPFKRTLTKEEWLKLEELFEQALLKSEYHTNKRAMMTGMIQIQKKQENKTCILLPNAVTKTNIELFLQQFQE